MGAIFRRISLIPGLLYLDIGDRGVSFGFGRRKRPAKKKTQQNPTTTEASVDGTSVLQKTNAETQGMEIDELSSLLEGHQVSEQQEQTEKKPVSNGEDWGRWEISAVANNNMDGTTRQSLIKKCRSIHTAGDYSRTLYLSCKKEPTNPYDEFAIAVFAEETKYLRSGESRLNILGQIGYLPKELAHSIYSKSSSNFWVFLDSPQFGQFTNDKGKPGISLSVKVKVRRDETAGV